MITENMISAEDSVVWTRDVRNLDYVRQTIERVRTRKATKAPRPELIPGQIIGFTTAKRDKSGWFQRRIFWLKSFDRPCAPEGVYRQGCPIEAVDPRTIAPKALGKLTERALGLFGRAPAP